MTEGEGKGYGRVGGWDLERQHVVRLALVPGKRLDTVPPAVVGTGELDDHLATRVEARQANRTHHRFGATHVERHFVLFIIKDTKDKRQKTKKDNK